MTNTNAAPATLDQAEFWNSVGGDIWLQYHRLIHQMMAPNTAALLNVARPQPGEHIIDVGCGAGDVSLAVASQIGSGGSVYGIDISAQLVSRANEQLQEQGSDVDVSFDLGDAGTFDFAQHKADLMLSRFGVMFFDDPAAAFSNLRGALAPGGRLVVLTWQAITESTFFTLPLSGVLRVLPAPPPAEPNAPGPFGLADPDYVTDTLTRAGFADIKLMPHTAEIIVPDLGGPFATAALFMQLGNARSMLEDAPDKADEVHRAIADVLTPHFQEDGLHMTTSTWIVSARNI